MHVSCHREQSIWEMRVDRIIHIGELGTIDRRALVTQYLSEDIFDEDALDQLVERTDGYTGAKVIDLVKTLLDLGTPGRDGQECDDDANDSDLHITLEVVERALRHAGGRQRRRRIGFVSQDCGDTRCPMRHDASGRYPC